MGMGFLRTEGGKVWCSVYGEDKSGIPLLVIHGRPGFQIMPQIISEFSADRPVYFYDQLGCGKSDRVEGNDYHSVKNYVNELDEVIRELKLSEVILMGFSWGCELVCSYMLEKEPKGVKALILSAPNLNSPLWDRDQRNNMTRTLSNIYERLNKENKIVIIVRNIKGCCWRTSEGSLRFVKQ